MMEMDMEMATTEKPLDFLPFLLIKLSPVPFLWIGETLGRERARAFFLIVIRRMKISNPSPPRFPLPFDDSMTCIRDYKHPLFSCASAESEHKRPIQREGACEGFSSLRPSEINEWVAVRSSHPLQVLLCSSTTCSAAYYLHRSTS